MVVINNRKIKGAVFIVCFVLAFLMLMGASVQAVHAEINTVTIKNGSKETYGSYFTRKRTVTHINGETTYGGNKLGGSRSLAYCVEPMLESLADGTYKAHVIGPDATGKEALMRKMIYYLPGANGYYNVTKSRWFGKKWYTKASDGCSDYVIGHLALSYLYDNKSSNTDAWKGTKKTMKTKTLSIVKDLSKLKNPPEGFEAFIVKQGNKQPYMGSIYVPEKGKLRIQKLSSNTKISSGNENYCLEGAEYALYTDEECEDNVYDADSRMVVFTTGSNGYSKAVEIEIGSYYLKELEAPKGYAIDTTVHAVNVTYNTTKTVQLYDVPQSNPVSILLQKIDADTHKAEPQKGTSFEGAEFTVKYYAVDLGSIQDKAEEDDESELTATESELTAAEESEAENHGDEAASLKNTAEGAAMAATGEESVTEAAHKKAESVSLNEEDQAEDASLNEEGQREDSSLDGDESSDEDIEEYEEEDFVGETSIADSELEQLISGKAPAQINGKEAVWVFRTDANGKIDFQNPDKYLVKDKSAELYTDSDGKYVLPIGVVSIQETKAPSGYLVNPIRFLRAVYPGDEGESYASFEALIGEDSVSELREPVPEPEDPEPEKPVKNERKSVIRYAPQTGDDNFWRIFVYLALGGTALISAMVLTVKRRGDRLNANKHGRR